MSRVRWRAVVVLVAALAAGCGGGSDKGDQGGSTTRAKTPAPTPIVSAGGKGGATAPVSEAHPVSKAHCGPNDHVETGVQGQTTVAERRSGDSERAYNCNLALVGQYQGQGAWWQMAWFRHCAYYGTTGYTQTRANRGVVVLDASDPEHPRMTARLTARAMLNPHESLKVNVKRKLLGGDGPGPDYVNQNSPWFAFYDISDCAHPKLLSQLKVPGYHAHAGDFSPDGRTYYGRNAPTGWTAIDISEPRHPKEIINWHAPGGIGVPHDLSVAQGGNRMYVAEPGNYAPFCAGGKPDGLVILDVSDIQARRPNPKVRVVSKLFWQDGGTAQQTIPVTISGKPAVIETDETGPGALAGAQASRVDACQRGLTPFGFARIIDISNERQPKVMTKLKLQVDDPANCQKVIDDFPKATTNRDTYGYSTHYCGVDRKKNPDLLACGYMGAGLRVFDIRDPHHPKEIAYYKPAAQRRKFLPGSAMWFDYAGYTTLHWTPTAATGKKTADRTTDRVVTQIRFVKRHGTTYIWFVSQDGGFQIVRFANGALANR